MRQMMNKCCMEQITEQRDEEKTQLFVWVLLNNRRKPRTGPGGGEVGGWDEQTPCGEGWDCDGCS